MIFHRGYDTDAYFSLYVPSPLVHPIPHPPLGLFYPLPMTHTRPSRLFPDYVSFSYSRALRLRYPGSDSFLVHRLILRDSCCTISMYIRAGLCVLQPHPVLRILLANPSILLNPLFSV
jgi:hypothetical protein